MSNRAPLHERGQITIIETLGVFELLLHKIQEEMTNNCGVPVITFDPGTVDSIASTLDVLLARHQQIVASDPILVTGEKIRNVFSIAAKEAFLHGAREVAFRPETLWICAWTLCVLYTKELEQGLIKQELALNFSGLSRLLSQRRSIDYLSFVERAPDLDQLAMMVRGNLQS